jgi:superfamily II DNA or RNA helicase
VFDGITIGADVQELIDLGRLVQPVYYCPSQVDLQGVHTRAGDYVKSELEERVDKPAITGDAVTHYRKLADGLPSVAFCVSRKHAQHVAAQFREAGYEAYAVDGMTDDKERDRILTGLGNGKVQVVASCDLISEGFDVPAIGCGIMLRPTKSMGLYIQQGGRVLRPQQGKERAIILDHVGNVFRHGLLEQPREWSLEGEVKKTKKKEKADDEQVNVRQCTSCYAVFAPAPKCPECGAEVKIKERKLEQKEGELVAIDKESVKAIAFEKKKEVGKARTLDELKAIEAQRGYKKGWAYNIWQARQIKSQHKTS